jgi:hypothetical protein
MYAVVAAPKNGALETEIVCSVHGTEQEADVERLAQLANRGDHWKFHDMLAEGTVTHDNEPYKFLVS